MDLEIRQARISDIRKLFRFYSSLDSEARKFYRYLLCNSFTEKIKCLRYLYLRILLNKIIYIISKRYLLMVLLLNQGCIVGVCHISITGEVGKYGIVIDKKYRKHGLGRILSERTISLATNLGVKKITLIVDEDNTRAINLYKKLGFKVIGVCWDSRITANGRRIPIRAIKMELSLKA